jgi:hypothetical protein
MKVGSPALHPENSSPKDTIAYAEILKIAHDEGLKSIATELLATPSDDNGRLAIVKAVVEVEKGRFEALGDADPTSVEERFIPHLIRVAETRAKARALRATWTNGAGRQCPEPPRPAPQCPEENRNYRRVAEVVRLISRSFNVSGSSAPVRSPAERICSLVSSAEESFASVRIAPERSA